MNGLFNFPLWFDLGALAQQLSLVERRSLPLHSLLRRFMGNPSILYRIRDEIVSGVVTKKHFYKDRKIIAVIITFNRELGDFIYENFVVPNSIRESYGLLSGEFDSPLGLLEYALSMWLSQQVLVALNSIEEKSPLIACQVQISKQTSSAKSKYLVQLQESTDVSQEAFEFVPYLVGNLISAIELSGEIGIETINQEFSNGLLVSSLPLVANPHVEFEKTFIYGVTTLWAHHIRDHETWFFNGFNWMQLPPKAWIPLHSLKIGFKVIGDKRILLGRAVTNAERHTFGIIPGSLLGGLRIKTE